MLKGEKIGRGSFLSSISELKFNIDKNDSSFIEIINKLKKIKSSFIRDSNKDEWNNNVIIPYKRIFNTSEIPEWLSSYYNFLISPEKNKIVSYLEDALMLSERKGDPFSEELDVYYWLNSIFLLNSSLIFDNNGKVLTLPNEIQKSYNEWLKAFVDLKNLNVERRQLQIKENNFYNELLKNQDIIDLIEFLNKKVTIDPFSIVVFQIVYSLKKKKIIIKNYLNSTIKRGNEFVICETNLTPFHPEFEENLFNRFVALNDEDDFEELFLSIIREKIDAWVLHKTNSLLEDSFIPEMRDFEFKSTTSELYKDEDLLKMISRSPLISSFFRSASSEKEKERLASLINQVINS